MTTRKRVLVACEFSGIVREAFHRFGHDAWSCDLLPTEIPGQHIQSDALATLASQDWDLVIAHPPCTFLTNAGVRWLYGKHGGSTVRDEKRWADMQAGAEFFRAFFLNYTGPLCIENPIMHRHAAELVGDPATLCDQRQTVQPWQFGHLESKATVLWLRGLPTLTETANVYAAMKKLPKSQSQKVWLCSPSPERWMMRSRTFPGIAEAMAAQWAGRVSGATVSFPARTLNQQLDLSLT
jgi:hypothetical protein